jgi:hypothetical protein
VVRDGTAAGFREAAVVALEEADFQEGAAALVGEAAAVRGKRFSRFANSLLVFRFYLAYFCASLKTVHEKG